MAFGLHWEWRGFGSVSERFLDLFGVLEPAYEPHDTEDTYVWAPGLSVNAKIRSGPGGGLKFKTIRKTGAVLEQWSENPDEVFGFPLSREGWEALARVLAGADIILGPYSLSPTDAETLLDDIMDSGCTIVQVRKRREGRIWKDRTSIVFVELTEIKYPEKITSIGLESEDCDPGSGDLPDHLAKGDLISALEWLGLDGGLLKSMSYLDAVRIWATGGTILSRSPL